MKPFYLVIFVTLTMAVVTEQNEGNDGDVVKMLQEMQERMKVIEEETKQLRDDKQALMKEMQKMKLEQDATNRWMNQTQRNGATVFLATHSEQNIPIPNTYTIIWDTALINQGGHYNTETGGYTAPVDGFYQFSATKQGNDGYGSFYFKVDDERYAYKYTYTISSTGSPASSATIILELTAGQVVSIENAGSSGFSGTNPSGFRYSWFTGYML